MAQPTKLIPELQEAMVQRLASGVPLQTACAHLRIAKQSHYNWIKRGEDERTRLDTARARPKASEAIYLAYMDAIEKALQEAHVRNLAIIQAAARGGAETDTTVQESFYADGRVRSRNTTTRRSAPQWQAAAWYLERRHPDLYARTIKSEVTGKDGGPIEGVTMTKDDYDAFTRENITRASHLAGMFDGEDDLV